MSRLKYSFAISNQWHLTTTYYCKLLRQLTAVSYFGVKVWSESLSPVCEMNAATNAWIQMRDWADIFVQDYKYSTQRRLKLPSKELYCFNKTAGHFVNFNYEHHIFLAQMRDHLLINLQTVKFNFLWNTDNKNFFVAPKSWWISSAHTFSDGAKFNFVFTINSNKNNQDNFLARPKACSMVYRESVSIHCMKLINI